MPFILCDLNPALLLTAIYFTTINGPQLWIPLCVCLTSLNSGMGSATVRNTHNTGWRINFTIFLFIYFIFFIILYFFISLCPHVCAYCKAHCDNPVSQKCFIKRLGSSEGWLPSEEHWALLALTSASVSVLEEAAFCLWTGSHNPTLFNRYSLPSWKTHVCVDLEARAWLSK